MKKKILSVLCIGFSIFVLLGCTKDHKEEYGDIKVEGNIVSPNNSSEANNSEAGMPESPFSVSIKDIDPGLVQTLPVESKDLFYLPETWSKEAVGMKKELVFEDINKYRKDLESAISTKDSFLAFKPYRISNNVDFNFIYSTEYMKERVASGEMDFELAQNMMREFVPAVRLSRIADMLEFTPNTIQPFEILIVKEDRQLFNEKLNELGGFVSAEFFADEVDTLPNGMTIPPEYLYMRVVSGYSDDVEVLSILSDKGFDVD